MPKMLVAAAPGVAAFQEYTDRPLQDDEVLCQVKYAAPKHGTELPEFKGTSIHAVERFDPEWQAFFPRGEQEPHEVVFGEWNLGNQWVGEVVRRGAQVADVAEGDWVCSYGGIRETHILKAVDNYRCRRLADKTLWKNALCYDPAQFALAGVRDGKVRPGDAVAVYGMGAIGQIAAQLCVRLGAAPVVVIDPLAHRCDMAMKHGAHAKLDPTGADVGLELKMLTGKRGVDVVIETSGHVSALQSALRGLAYGGTISYVAFAKPFAALELGREAHFNYANLVFSRACSEPLPDYPRWSRRRIEDVCWEMLTNGHLDCADIIDPVVPFAECDRAYGEYLDKNPQQSIKLGIRFAAV